MNSPTGWLTAHENWCFSNWFLTCIWNKWKFLFELLLWDCIRFNFSTSSMRIKWRRIWSHCFFCIVCSLFCLFYIYLKPNNDDIITIDRCWCWNYCETPPDLLIPASYMHCCLRIFAVLCPLFSSRQQKKCLSTLCIKTNQHWLQFFAQLQLVVVVCVSRCLAEAWF